VLEALRGLTTLGRSFLAAGAAAGLSALVLGETDLLRVAVLLLVLPLLAAAYVGRGRHRLACSRSLDPHRIPTGARAQVRLRLQNLSALPTGTLLLEDRLPYALGSRPRLVLDRLGGGQASSVTYSVRAEARGRYEVGPLVVRLTDPFGLCELTRSFPNQDRLTVIPEVVPLPAIRLAGEFTGTGESRARSVAVHGEDDAATREYRHGDDLRRVHWRSTARVGELMVRREEQPWESRATVVLDTRSAAHRGEGPGSSFEWAVSGAASIALHLRQAGWRLRLVTPGVDVSAIDGTGDGRMLDYLAEVTTRHQGSDVAKLVEQVRSGFDGGLVIGLFGMLTAAEAELLTRLRASGVTCVGFLIDSSTWMHLPPEARQQAEHRHRTAVGILFSAGWRVISVTHGARLAGLWPQAARGAQGFALRAALAETVAGGKR